MEDIRYILGEPIDVDGVGTIYPLTISEYIKNAYLFYPLGLNVNKLIQQMDATKIEEIALMREHFVDFDLIMNNKDSFECFIELLELVMKININELKILKDDEGYLYIESDLCHIDRYNYPIFREVVCTINEIPIPNDNPNKELQYWFDKARKIKGRNSKITLEDIITTVVHCVGLSYSEIKGMTMYQLNKQLERANLIREHEIATLSALVGGKSEVPPFMRHAERQKDNLSLSLDEFQNKLGMKVN